MLQPQTILQNRYEISEQLGQGGMGAVYVAIDQRFGSTVAVKETFFNDGNLRKAFEREAHLLNSLRHPALPRVSDHFAENDGQFLVMEFIEGEDLGEMLDNKSGAFPVEQVLHWADQLLDALNYLHTQVMPIIHRDIKPQNLKLMSSGQIILLDFGLAKGSPSQGVNRATNTGSIFGYSRHYAPLEQIQGSGTDPRSDIYSLAATLYHLMTGVIPPDALSRATAVINGQPDPLLPANEIHAQVNPAVAQVLNQAMSQTSANRQASAAIMRSQLREAASAALADEKPAKPFATPQTILDLDTKIMEDVQTGDLQSAPFNALETVKMTEADIAQVSASLENATVASNPQVVSNPNPSLNATITETDSEITKIATHVPKGSQRSGMSRYLGIAVVVVLIFAVCGLAYRYAFKQTQTETPLPVQNATENQNNSNVAMPVGETNAAGQNTNTQENKSTKQPSQTTEQRRKQTQTTSTTNKTNNNDSNNTQSSQTTNEKEDHSTTGTQNTRTTRTTQQTAPYPNNMTEAERRRQMEMKKQMQRRRMQQIRRGKIPPERPK